MMKKNLVYDFTTLNHSHTSTKYQCHQRKQPCSSSSYPPQGQDSFTRRKRIRALSSGSLRFESTIQLYEGTCCLKRKNFRQEKSVNFFSSFFFFHFISIHFSTTNPTSYATTCSDSATTVTSQVVGRCHLLLCSADWSCIFH